MILEKLLVPAILESIYTLWNIRLKETDVPLQKTRKEFKGDVTLVTFGLSKIAKKAPEETGILLGTELMSRLKEVNGFNSVKGFLNIEISERWWVNQLAEIYSDPNFGFTSASGNPEMMMVEYSSPNTNKPLHLGHVRNNLLGFSIARLLEATGKKVIKANLVNDRGIHICKSMLAWQKWGKGETPQSSGIKGDHLVGKYYVLFEQERKKQTEELLQQGFSDTEAAQRVPLMEEAQEMLRKWEAGDPEIVGLWKMMNGWVYEGFHKTYSNLGVSFDKIYYESETYLLGKEIVLESLKNNILYQKEDNSVWADMTTDGLDHKLLLRSDGTSVYMTQDIGTAVMRFKEYPISQLIYVVGNEQNYHFQALSLIMQKMGFGWARNLHHLSYGMVELPDGKMKSREGTVVDADDLMDEMFSTAREMSVELGKVNEEAPEEADEIIRIIGLGALKYFILKVDPKKNMTFDPKESVDFNGNTGPFIQYTYARIKSLLRKAEEGSVKIDPSLAGFNQLLEKEQRLIGIVKDFPVILQEAANTLNPSLVANYVYELSKEYNQYYHDHSILKADNQEQINFRLVLSSIIGSIVYKGMYVLGIEVPERM